MTTHDLIKADQDYMYTLKPSQESQTCWLTKHSRPSKGCNSLHPVHVKQGTSYTVVAVVPLTSRSLVQWLDEGTDRLRCLPLGLLLSVVPDAHVTF